MNFQSLSPFSGIGKREEPSDRALNSIPFTSARHSRQPWLGCDVLCVVHTELRGGPLPANTTRRLSGACTRPRRRALAVIVCGLLLLPLVSSAAAGGAVTTTTTTTATIAPTTTVVSSTTVALTTTTAASRRRQPRAQRRRPRRSRPGCHYPGVLSGQYFRLHEPCSFLGRRPGLLR